MRGLSLRELGDELKGYVSHSALAKYESGDMMPGTDVLGKLADALGQSVDFFFRPFTLHLKQIRFRKKARLSPKTETAIVEQALEYFERFHEIEELLGDARDFTGKLQVKRVKTVGDAERCADRLRDEWELGRDPLPNVIELMESKGIKVFEVEVADDSFDGFSAETEAGPVIVLASWLNRNLLRKRMTAVHELAHVVLPLQQSLSEKDQEDIARRFAGAFLLPQETFVAEFGKLRHGISIGELIELKLNFGASIWAIMMRARQLQLISEGVFKQFCRQASRWRSMVGEPGDDEYSGNESHSRFRQLVHRAISEEEISLAKGAALLGESLSDVRKELQTVIT